MRKFDLIEKENRDIFDDNANYSFAICDKAAKYAIALTKEIDYSTRIYVDAIPKTRGINCLSPDNFDTAPLHLTCGQGLEEPLQWLLVLSTELHRSVNNDSLRLGTPLYIGAQMGT